MGLEDNYAGDEFKYRGQLSGQRLADDRFGVEDKGGDAGAGRGGINDG